LQGRPEKLWIELKTSFLYQEGCQAHELVDRVMMCVHACQSISQVRLISFDWQALAYVAQKYPEVTVGYLSEKGFEDVLKKNILKPGDFWNVCFKELTPEIVQKAENQGIVMGAWTINTRSDFEKVLALNIKAVTTDNPTIFKSFMPPDKC
jgi:glycerophosphoryl diester phosphodiesterase